MADNSEEISVINHLLKVEKEAYALIDEALKDSEIKIASARAASDSEYREKYGECVRKLENEYKNNLASISEGHHKLLEEYKSQLVNQPQNYQAFEKFLDKILFASEQ